MCAYNTINGEPACANEFLLQDQLRGKWGFKGYVVSDCGAVVDIYAGHHYNPTQAEASAICLHRGMDNECIDFTTTIKDDHDYKPYLDAVKQGFLEESEIDTAVTRLFTARMKLGMFDPPEMVPYNKIDESLLDSAAASRHGPQTRRRIDGAAQERRRASAEGLRHQDRRGRSAGRADPRPAGQLQRHTHPHRLNTRRHEGRVPRRNHQLCRGHAVPQHSCRSGSLRIAEHRWQARREGLLFPP